MKKKILIYLIIIINNEIIKNIGNNKLFIKSYLLFFKLRYYIIFCDNKLKLYF